MSTPTFTADAGLDEPGRSDDEHDQDAGSGANSEMDAAAPNASAGPPCGGDAGDASSDAADAAEITDGDAAANDAGDAAQIEAGANFPEASTDADAAAADAASDAPYSAADGAACTP